MPAKVNEIVNRLNRTKKELYPDLSSEKEAFDRGVGSLFMHTKVFLISQYTSSWVIHRLIDCSVDSKRILYLTLNMA